MKKPMRTGLFFLYLSLAAFLYAAPVDISGGNLKLTLYPDTGSFSLLQLSEIGKNRYEPLFEDRNFSTTSWFSVLANGRIFKLAKKLGKPLIAEQTTKGARFVFTLTDDFQVTQEFSFIVILPGITPNALQIRTVIENTSGKVGTFALKALVDTMLGESEGIHFFTDVQKRISAETKIVPQSDSDSIIISRNKNLSCMFLLKGYGITSPDTVYISNWDRLNTMTWTPEFVEGRSYNTVYSVYDSALLYLWPEHIVEANEKVTYTMVIGPYIANTVDSVSVKTATNEDNTALLPNQNNASKQLLIQQLLDRIDQIEKKPSIASDDELVKLNKALDAMLQEIKE